MKFVFFVYLIIANLFCTGAFVSCQFPRHSHRVQNSLYCVSSTGSASIPKVLRELVDKLKCIDDDTERFQHVLDLGNSMSLAKKFKVKHNLVPGCQSTVHIRVSRDENGLIQLACDADSFFVKGLASLLCIGLSGATPQEILDLDSNFIDEARVGSSLTPSRMNGFGNMLTKIKSLTKEVLKDNVSGGDPA